jgi:hypothetical protein
MPWDLSLDNVLTPLLIRHRAIAQKAPKTSLCMEVAGEKVRRHLLEEALRRTMPRQNATGAFSMLLTA